MKWNKKIVKPLDEDMKSLGWIKESKLSDFVPAGRTEIWYMNKSFFKDGIMGVKWLQKKNLMPTKHTLNNTHILLGKIKETNLDKIYSMMQGENWSPEGEARGLIRSKGLMHTSMSMGDIIVVNGVLNIVDSIGFRKIKEDLGYISEATRFDDGDAIGNGKIVVKNGKANGWIEIGGNQITIRNMKYDEEWANDVFRDAGYKKYPKEWNVTFYGPNDNTHRSIASYQRNVQKGQIGMSSNQKMIFIGLDGIIEDYFNIKITKWEKVKEE